MAIKFAEIVVPKNLVPDKEANNANFGRFFAEPFERGYGHTIGNSLRRILLSSLEGAAVVAARIKGAPHEYAVLPGMREDVATFLLNLKLLKMRLFTEAETLTLSVKGEEEVKAKHIQKNPNVEILNPDLVLATLAPASSLQVELEVRRGRGYVPSEKNHREGAPVGTLFLDSTFTPVSKVHYEVENARVGQMTDYDRLIMEIWTDGSVKPEDALAYSAKILKDSVNLFINFEEETPAAAGAVPAPVMDEDKLKEILSSPVDIIELSVRAANCLKRAEIKTIGELVGKREEDLLNYKNFGKKSLEEIKVRLKDLGFSLAV